MKEVKSVLIVGSQDGAPGRGEQTSYPSNFKSMMPGIKHEDMLRESKKLERERVPLDYREKMSNSYPRSPYSRSDESLHNSQGREVELAREQERKLMPQSAMKVPPTFL